MSEDQSADAPLQSPPGDPAAEAKDEWVGLRKAADPLAKQAKEAEEPERKRLLEAALALDPRHVQARLMYAEYAASPSLELELLRNAREDADRYLAEVGTGDDPGVYFRARIDSVVARNQLGHACWRDGLLIEARRCFEAVLEVDPRDYLKARHGLLACHLTTKEFDLAARLLDRYPEDESAPWNYGRALAAFVRRPDGPATRRLFEDAVGFDPMTGRMLLLNEPECDDYADQVRLEIASLPEDEREDELADLDDAEYDALLFRRAWVGVEGALERLSQVVMYSAKSERVQFRPAKERPAQGSDAWRSELQAAPPIPADVWRIDLRRLDGWAPCEDGTIGRAWLTTVWSGAARDFRGFRVVGGEPSSERLLAAFAEAVLEPQGKDAQPGRPETVELAPHPALKALEPDLQALGAACRAADPVGSPEMEARIADSNEAAAATRPPALVAVQGLSPAERKSFYQAAEGFVNAAPWRKVLRQDLLCVEAAGSKPWKRYVVVMGGAGTSPGLAALLDLRSLGADSTWDEGVATVDFLRFYSLPATDYDDVLVDRKATFADDHWPLLSIRAGEEGEVEAPTPLDVEAATVCLRAAASFADKAGAARRKGFKLHVEYGGRRIEAAVKPVGAK